MEHLPQMTDAALPPLQVPYLCGDLLFDDKGISGFPGRIGWQSNDNTSSVRPVNSGRTEEEVSALLQAWLFFGLLSEVFSVSSVLIEREDFVRETDDGNRVITTGALRGYLDEWESREKLCKEEVQRSHLREVVATLSEANDAANSNLGMSTPFPESYIPHPETEILILILGETLMNAASVIWPFWADIIEPGEFGLRSHFSRWQSAMTRRRMLQNSWCASDAALLHQILDQTGLYILSTLSRPAMQNHDQCLWEKCLANDIDERVYRTKHVHNGCSCDHIAADSGEISSIIVRGGSPRIIVRGGEDDGDDIRVGSTDSGPYVAISHVWSHGLGNAQNNSLPRCQLFRLHKQIKALHPNPQSSSEGPEPPLALWIDTLCVPVQPQYKASRKLSIRSLASTYQNADKVLVLDAELQQASSQCSSTEICARILCSSWMRRLWTLQEGAMAGTQSLYYQFRDGVVGHQLPASSHLPTQDGSRLYFSQVLNKAVAYRMPTWAYGPDIEVYDRLRGFSTALQYRTTSKLEDETLCLAGLIQLNTSDILDKPSAPERLKCFFRLLNPNIPSNFLFTSGQKLDEDGYRWAPVSLLSTSTSLFGSPGPPGFCDADGLHANYHGIFLSADGCPIYRLFDVKVQHNAKWYSIALPRPAGQYSDNFHTLQRPALVLTPDSHFGVLVNVYREEGGVLFAQFLCTASIFYPEPGNMLDVNLEAEKAATGNARRRVITGEWISVDRQWCIG